MNKNKTVGFIGDQPKKFGFALDASSRRYARMVCFISIFIIMSVEQGCDTFLCGMSRGFDMICGEMVLRLRRLSTAYAHLKLVCILPYQNHTKLWQKTWKKRYDRLTEQADAVISLAQYYHPDCFYARNRYMVEHSCRLICYFDKKEGREPYPCRYAEKMGLDIMNIARRL